MRITALVLGVTTEFGIAIPVGSTVEVGYDYGLSLVRALRASDTDGVLGAPNNPPFSPTPLMTAPNNLASSTAKKAMPSARGSNIEVWAPGSAGAYANNGPVNSTWQVIYAPRSAVYAAQVTYRNPQNAAVTINATSITPSTTYVPNGDPTGGIPGVNVLFGGAASVALPASGAAADVESFTKSDIALVRTAGPYLHLRSYCALANYSYITQANMANYGRNTAGDLVRQISFQNNGGDKVTVPAGYVGAGGAQNVLPLKLDLFQLSRHIRMAAIGDSITNCSTFTVGGQLANWLEGAANVLNAEVATSQVYFSAANFGWPSQSLPTYLARLAAVLTNGPYDIVFIQGYSPNSAPNTQALADAVISNIVRAVNQVRVTGAIPILLTGIPSSLIPDVATDTFRKSINTLLRQFASLSGTALVDVAPLFTDNAALERIPAIYSGDGVHITTALGQSVFVNAVVNQIRVAA